MTNRGYDDMGPRIDLGPETEEDHLTSARRRARSAVGPSGRPASGGRAATGLAVLALVLSLFALGLVGFNLMTAPEPIPQPPPGPGVVPGATAERVAKLDKDVRDLILEVLAIKKQMTSLEKQLYSMRGRAGAVTKLTELSAKLAALQDRIKAMEKGRPAPAPRAAAPATPATPKPAAAAPAAGQSRLKKHVYKVQRGDTLWVVAQRYRVKTSDLRRWNNLRPGTVIKVGQNLVIYK